MKKFFVFVVLFLSVFLATDSLAQKFEYQQMVHLMFAYNYGNTLQYKGQGWGETIASILYQETHGGHSRYVENGIIVGDMDHRGKPKSLGLMQVQLPSARDVERWFPDVFFQKFGEDSPTEEELIIALLSDYRFNIVVGSHYFMKMLELKGSWREAILAYNRGAGNDGADPNDYVKKVLKWRKEIVLPMVQDRMNYFWKSY